MRNQHRDEERQRAARWKTTTATLPDEARAPASYIGKSGKPSGAPYDFCLPPEWATHTLLPDVRAPALQLFAELEIPWHCGVAGGPGNHLLSSQVQCVNALLPMVHDRDLLQAAFGDSLDIAEVLEIEPGRFLTFEFIGPTDYFDEGKGGPRIRGAHCTSVDAAFRYRTSTGSVDLALVEWKYTEEYSQARREPAKTAERRRRCAAALADPAGPVRDDVLPFEDLLLEPIYQLVRQQLLAWELERARVLDADVVRVVHVLPPDNHAYQQSLVLPSQRVVGATVDDVWSALLRRPDRFQHLDPKVFVDVRGGEYAARYARAL